VNLPARLSRSTLACMLLAACAVGVAEASSLLCLLLAAMLAGGWWFNERASQAGRRSVSMPRWASTLLLVLAMIAAGARGYFEQDAISSFLWLMAGILALKAWQVRRPGDYGQMVTVSVFMGIGATLSDNSLLLGVVLAVLTPTAVHAAMLCQLHGAASSAGRATEAVPLGPRDMAALRRLGVVAVAFGLAGAVVAFLFIPRGIGLRRFGDFGQAIAGRVTGFVDEVDLSKGGLISESQTRVMDVRLADLSGSLITQDRTPLYLRGAVLDSYTGREWKRSRADDETRVVVRRLTPGAPETDLPQRARLRLEPDADALVQKVSIRQTPRGDATMFTLWRPRRVRVVGGTDIEFDIQTARMANKGEGGRLEYEVVSVPRLATDARIAPSRRGDMPAQSPRLTDLAASVLRGAGVEPVASRRAVVDDVVAVQAIVDHLRRTCSYTLDVPPPPLRDDPVEHFLLETRTGHCELFAASLAGLCRAAGIDARVIAGYMATEFEPETATYVVRQSHAHAWCEVEVAPGHWRTFDATPPAGIEELRERGNTVLGRLTQLFADLRDRWNLNVVTFDASSQQRLLGASERDQPWFARFAESISRGEEPDRVRAAQVVRRLREFAWAAAATVAAVAAVVIVAMILHARRRRLATERSAGWAVAGREAARLSRELDLAFRRLGDPRPAWRPPLRHAAALSRVEPSQRRMLEQAAERLYVATFDSSAPADDAGLRASTAAVRGLSLKQARGVVG
jgi:transglutaminase-like putative cysteine protease